MSFKGLHEERKLWSQELASQGASLAQDQGRLESQIESVTREVSELQNLYQVSKILHVTNHCSITYQNVLVNNTLPIGLVISYSYIYMIVCCKL